MKKHENDSIPARTRGQALKLILTLASLALRTVHSCQKLCPTFNLLIAYLTVANFLILPPVAQISWLICKSPSLIDGQGMEGIDVPAGLT